jgi:hypothetical protein
MTSFTAPLRVLTIAEPAAEKGSIGGNRAMIPAAPCVPDGGNPDSRRSDPRGAGNLSLGQASRMGMRNVRRVLPVAKDLTVEALGSAALRFGVPPPRIKAADRLIASANRVVLDKRLGDAAMVNDRCPSEIRIGPVCAAGLLSDDAAVFILAHELIHVGNAGDDLEALAEMVTREASSMACVSTTDWQQGDLACDFIAQIVLRNFVGRRPTSQCPEERICLTLTAGNAGDKTHLSDAQTLRALIGLDPQLRRILMTWLGGPQINDYAIIEPLAVKNRWPRR